MGFPVGYTEVFMPSILIHTLCFLGLIKNLLSSLFTLLGLSNFHQTDFLTTQTAFTFPENPTRNPVYAALIREILPVVKFQDLVCSGYGGRRPEAAEEEEEEEERCCAVCLCGLDGGDEIRWLSKCEHIFHLACLDRWMDHDRDTCPLCRSRFVPDELIEEFNRKLWAAADVAMSDEFGDFYNEFDSVS